MRSREEAFEEYKNVLRIIPELKTKSQVKKFLAKLHNLEREIRQIESIKEINNELNEASEEACDVEIK